MNTQKDPRAELDYWTDIWSDMEQEHIHPPVEKVTKQMSPFAAHMLGDPTDDADDSSQDSYDNGYDELFQEENVANPIFPDSVGPDNQGPKPVWVNEKLLDEVKSLKDRLFKVENEMARLGQGKKFSEKVVVDDGKKLMDVIESIRKQIDKVSSQIGIKDEPSPYNVKRS